MTEEEINIVTERVVANIKEKYFLTEKTFNISAKSYELVAFSEFIENVIFQTCKYFHIDRETITGKSRKQHNEFITYPEIRFIAMDLCRELPEHPISHRIIAEYFNADHATVVHGQKKIKKLRKKDWFNYDYIQVEKLVNESLRL